MAKDPVRVLVTGVAGQTGRALVSLLARGMLLGPDQSVILHMLDIPSAAGCLNGVKMELVDAAFPLLKGVVATTDVVEACTGVNVAIMVGGSPRRDGMRRKTLMSKNVSIINFCISALEKHAAANCRRVLVLVDPYYNNAMNEVAQLVSEKLNVQVSSTLYPDVTHATDTTPAGDTAAVLKEAKPIIQLLGKMDRVNAEILRLPECKLGTRVANGLLNRFKELEGTFEVSMRMMEYKKMVIVEEVNEELTEKIISSGTDGQGSEEFLPKAIQEHGWETVVETQDDHDAPKEIETSLLELRQMLVDMAVKVVAQGEKMDDIEHHVMNTAHYVNDGAKNLKTAKGYQKQSGKCACIGIILLLIIILVVVIPFVTSVAKSYS